MEQTILSILNTIQTMNVVFGGGIFILAVSCAAQWSTAIELRRSIENLEQRTEVVEDVLDIVEHEALDLVNTENNVWASIDGKT